jgi:hypothetical protein
MLIKLLIRNTHCNSDTFAAKSKADQGIQLLKKSKRARVESAQLQSLPGTQPLLAQAQSGLAQPQPELAHPQPGLAQPQPGVAQSQTGLVQPQPGRVQPQPGPAQPKPVLAQPKPGLTKSQPGVAKPQAQPYHNIAQRQLEYCEFIG